MLDAGPTRRSLLHFATAMGVGAPAAAPAVALTPPSAGPPPRHETRIAWWRDAKFGMFVTLGPTSVIGRGDWVMGIEDIPLADYRRAAESFRPDHGAPREWARLARKAGQKYMILVAKHHDGYCLWDTRTTDFNAVQTGPRRDIVAEYVAAARAEGLKVGLYCSLLDWSHPDGMASQTDTAARERFVAYIHAQLRELLSGYGPIDILWYDVGVPLGPQQWRSQAMNDMALALQPRILVNNRNWLPGDFATPEQTIDPQAGDWESCMTLNGNWFFTPGDLPAKGPAEVVRNLTDCARGGGNYALNLAPRPDGGIPEDSRATLEAVGGWLARNGEAIYGAERTSNHYSMTCGFTAKRATLYVHLRCRPGGELPLGRFEGRALTAQVVAGGAPLPLRQDADGRVTLGGLPPPDPIATVVAVTFDRPPRQVSLAATTARRLHQLYDETGIRL